MNDEKAEIARLKGRISRLQFLCLGLAILIVFGFKFLNIHSFYVTDDLGLIYSPGLFAKKEDTVGCYFSTELREQVVGYYQASTGEWIDVAWVISPK